MTSFVKAVTVSVSVVMFILFISVVRFFQEYTEPDENSSGSQVPSHRRDVNPLHPSASHTEEDKVLLPLGEDTLSQNLGIPIVVVITKVSLWKGLIKKRNGAFLL
jgi:dynein light intermediate chain 1